MVLGLFLSGVVHQTISRSLRWLSLLLIHWLVCWVGLGRSRIGFDGVARSCYEVSQYRRYQIHRGSGQTKCWRVSRTPRTFGVSWP